MKTTVFLNPLNLLEASQSDNRINVIMILVEGTLSFKIQVKIDVLYSARAESIPMNKGHLLYVSFNLFRGENLCILSIGKKIYFSSGVNYKQCGSMKGLSNQILKPRKSSPVQEDQLVIDKGLAPLTFHSPIPYFTGSRVSIPVIQLLLLEIERTHSSFSSSSAKL